VWDETTGAWTFVKGSYEIQLGRSISDRRLTATINV
jgi:beta-glucosidase